jgi:alpha-galactosidase
VLIHIKADWARISEIANENSFKMNYVGFWGHPDPDMLEIGNGNLTAAENRAHFALWAVMKSPLIIGTAVSVAPQVPFFDLSLKFQCCQSPNLNSLTLFSVEQHQ